VVNKLHPNLTLVVIPSDLCVTEELPSIDDILKLRMSLHTMMTWHTMELFVVTSLKITDCRE